MNIKNLLYISSNLTYLYQQFIINFLKYFLFLLFLKHIYKTQLPLIKKKKKILTKNFKLF